IFTDPDYDNIIFGLYYNNLVISNYETNYEKGILGFSSFDLTMENLVNNYPTPNEIEFNADKMVYTYVLYSDNDLPFYIQCRIDDIYTSLYVCTGDIRELISKK
ncbi:MAG: hypothetical protein J1E40_06560, partial [Oscillospiraceae bacterium]|nr:hypothetical protein [Oscillospiraceae bacterium]